MTPERLLRIAAVYHAVVGAVLVLLPIDFFAFLKVELPRHWLFYFLAVSAPLVAGAACEVARRRTDLRPGLLVGLIMGNVAAASVVILVATWTGMPTVMLGSGVAAGLWAWLLWGVYSPDAGSPASEPDPPKEPEEA